MPQFVEEIVEVKRRPIHCKYCDSPTLWKNGTQYGVQYYMCPNCHRKTNGEDKFPHTKHSRDTVIKALTYYYNGISFEGVKNVFDDLEGLDVNPSTIWRWILKFTNLVIPFVDDVKPPNIGTSWYADETQVKVRVAKIDPVTRQRVHEERWLWAVIDDKTRYLLSSKFTKSRTTKTATELFRDAYLHSGVRCTDLYTDKLQAYIKAFKNVFYSRYKAERSYHWQSHGFGSGTNINLIERWNEYVKQRYKIMRNFKRPDSAELILKGIIINYNWLWEHSGIGNIPPAQKAGIDIEGLGIKNWGDLIDLAYKFRSEKQKNPSDFTFWLSEQERLERRNPIDLNLDALEGWKRQEKNQRWIWTTEDSGGN